MTQALRSFGAGPWVEVWLSPARYGVYLAEASGDRERALELYQWNTSLTCAVLHDLGHLEVALRNAYAAALDATWRGAAHWLDDPASPLRAPLLRAKKVGPHSTQHRDINHKVRQAIDAARDRHGTQAPPGKIIADLSLGQWRYLSSSAHEKTLWIPHLHKAFPPGTDRAMVDRAIGKLHQLRNRAAHWEPLLATPVKRRMEELVWVAGLLSADLAGYIRYHSRVAALLDERP
ncbi:Abi family protein [Streptomyces sp. B6B3]|uniref:Abi family protein n=1 Tax=Streptomyces sp. B6B3 TaxID=3153570 RepID=UPI00325CD01B